LALAGIELNDVGYLRQADYIDQEINAIFRVNKPKGILLSYYFELEQAHHWSFGGENLGDELDSHARFQFKNLWKVDLVFDRNFNTIDTRVLRGGPSLRIDNHSQGEIFVQTNSSKNLFLGAGYELTRFDEKISKENEYTFYAYWLINNRLSLSSRTMFTTGTDNSQYILQKVISNKREYVVGKLDRKTISSTIRAEFFVTPEFSLQYYGNPYASSGKFLDYRKVADSKSKDLNRRFLPLSVAGYDQQYVVDENHNPVISLSSANPDFNFQEFRSNFVARWEYKTGSTVYFVWTNNRSRYESIYEPSVINSLKGISKVKAQNAFMIKLSYWFSL
jgi:hypothetical protein